MEPQQFQQPNMQQPTPNMTPAPKHSSKFWIGLVMGIIIGLILAFVFQTLSSMKYANVSGTIPNYDPTVLETTQQTGTNSNTPQQHQPTQQSEVIQPDWSVISIQELIDAETLSLLSQPISFIQSVDLTGDGVAEALYRTYSGNQGIIFIAQVDTDGNIKLAQQKNYSGGMGTVQISQIGLISTEQGYKLLPDINAYYVYTKERDQNIETESVYNCTSLAAYQWNQTTQVFEYNSQLTATYQPQVCG